MSGTPGPAATTTLISTEPGLNAEVSRYHRRGDRCAAGARRRSESVDVRPGSRRRSSHEQEKDRQLQRTRGAIKVSRGSIHSLLTRWETLPQRGQTVLPATAATTGALSAVGTENGAEECRFTIQARCTRWGRGVGVAAHRTRRTNRHRRSLGGGAPPYKRHSRALGGRSEPRSTLWLPPQLPGHRRPSSPCCWATVRWW